jgi:hypothetical protein
MTATGEKPMAVDSCGARHRNHIDFACERAVAAGPVQPRRRGRVDALAAVAVTGSIALACASIVIDSVAKSERRPA